MYKRSFLIGMSISFALIAGANLLGALASRDMKPTRERRPSITDVPSAYVPSVLTTPVFFLTEKELLGSDEHGPETERLARISHRTTLHSCGGVIGEKCGSTFLTSPNDVNAEAKADNRRRTDAGKVIRSQCKTRPGVSPIDGRTPARARTCNEPTSFISSAGAQDSTPCAITPGKHQDDS